MADYAFLNEIWIDPSKVAQEAPPQCSLVNRKDNAPLDNIMDAYISEESAQQKYVSAEDQTPVKKCIDVNAIQGYEENSSLLKYAYNLDSYYDNDIKTIKNSIETTPPTQDVCTRQVATRQEQDVHNIPIYRDMVESYANSPPDNKTMYIELIIYILSGIFLIFIMEQILQIGRYIKIK